jgi:phosphodiesterase/alkaline phosphatase D-like protein
MNTRHLRSQGRRWILFSIGIAVLFAVITPSAEAAFTFTGVAAGDATSTEITLWTRAADDAAPVTATVTLELATDSGFTNIVFTSSGTTAASNDYTLKFAGSGLQPSTVYYYRFRSGVVTSIVGTFKTAPPANASVPVHFAFSGDNDGLMRPYALASVIPAQNLDFYINLGDVIYETASKVNGNNGASWLNSPSVTLSNDSLSFNGVPRAFIPGGTPFATQAQLFGDYSKKYRENFLPVNAGGQNSLQVLYAAQGNYTTWDNHELGNRKYIDGGAPAGGSVGGPTGTDMNTGRGVDARAGGSGNVNNVNDVNTSTTDFMNRSTGFLTLQRVFLNYQPIADLGDIDAPNDSRTDGTKRLYSAHPWGKNAIYINTDSRSYRDIRIKTANASADDTTSPRADNPQRTYLGATQLNWLEQTLLDAQNAGTTWKFVSVSDPVDQIGAIGSGADSGKSYMGGYRAERNALLTFIADHQIINVVFLSTDDHQNRLNELMYSPTGQTDLQSSYIKVPYCFSIVAGPLGATGPDAITDHSFSNIKLLADTLAHAQAAAGVEPIGLEDYPGLYDVVREGDPTADVSPQAVDFYSPDTFNFTVLDVSGNGKTLTVKSIGMNSTAQNAGQEYDQASPARMVFSFKIHAAVDRNDHGKGGKE